MTTHCCEIHTTKRHNRSDKLSYALLGDRTETANSQTKIEHAERSKKDALSAHIQDPTVRNFPIIFLKFDIYHVAPLRIEISLFPAYINK